MRQPVSFCDKEGAKREIFVEELQGPKKEPMGQVLIRILSKSKRKCRLRMAKQGKCNMVERSVLHFSLCVRTSKLAPQTKNRPGEKVGFVFEKVQEFRNLLWSKHLRAYLPSRSDAHNGNLQRRGIKAKPVTVKQLQAFSCKINL